MKRRFSISICKFHSNRLRGKKNRLSFYYKPNLPVVKSTSRLKRNMCIFSKDIQSMMLVYTLPLLQAVNADYSWKEEIMNMIVSRINSNVQLIMTEKT